MSHPRIGDALARRLRADREQRWVGGTRWAAAIVFVVFGAGKFVDHTSELASFHQYGLPAPDAFVYAIGMLEIAGGMLLAGRALVRVVALMLAIDMVGAIIVSGIGRGEILSLTLAPALLLAMIVLLQASPTDRALDRPPVSRLNGHRGGDVV
ncbi:MAG: DoxX family protein [Actinomycetota bacterium]|nr:DoxX family protein [Actinomycetota bacterium]